MFYILAFTLLISTQTGHHTMTSIEYVPGTDSIKVVIRFDYDLFLKDFQQTVNDDISLETLRKYKPFPFDQANKYLNSKMTILIDNKVIFGKLLNLDETLDDDVVMKIVYCAGKTFKNITIRNTLLTGLYSDVQNLTIVRLNNIEKGIKLTSSHNSETLTCD